MPTHTVFSALSASPAKVVDVLAPLPDCFETVAEDLLPVGDRLGVAQAQEERALDHVGYELVAGGHRRDQRVQLEVLCERLVLLCGSSRWRSKSLSRVHEERLHLAILCFKAS